MIERKERVEATIIMENKKNNIKYRNIHFNNNKRRRKKKREREKKVR
jgi:hypothetical protein